MSPRLIATTLLVTLLVVGTEKPVTAGPRVERNVVFGMYSGLALVMDVYPQRPQTATVSYSFLGAAGPATLTMMRHH